MGLKAVGTMKKGSALAKNKAESLLSRVQLLANSWMTSMPEVLASQWKWSAMASFQEVHIHTHTFLSSLQAWNFLLISHWKTNQVWLCSALGGFRRNINIPYFCLCFKGCFSPPSLKSFSRLLSLFETHRWEGITWPPSLSSTVNSQQILGLVVSFRFGGFWTMASPSPVSTM